METDDSAGGNIREVTELAAHLSRVFASYRLYGLRHDRAVETEQELMRRLEAHLVAHQELTFTVAEDKLRWKESKVLEDDRKEESITRVLYADGVESMTFFHGLEEAELRAYLHIWQRAVARELGVEHSFATLVWEEDFQNISTGLQPGLIERTGDPESEQKREGRVTQLVQSIASETNVPGLGATRRIALNPSSLSALTQIEAFRQLTPAELERRAQVEGPPPADLTDAERTALTTTMGMGARGQGQRSLYSLWRLFPVGERSQRAEIVDFAKRIIGSLVEAGRTDDTARAMTRIADLAKGTPRFERHFSEFLSSLSDEELVAHLARQVDQSEQGLSALGLLRLLPDLDVDLLFEPLSGARGRVREQLSQLIVDKSPRPESLAQWLLFERGESADLVFRMARKLGDEHLDMVIRSGTIHDDEAVRVLALEAIEGERATNYWSLMQSCIDDPSMRVRQSAVIAFLKSRDPRSFGIAREYIESPQTERALALSIVRGLGHVGGPPARALLVQALQVHPDREVRAAAALALSNDPDKAAVALIKRMSRGLFRDRSVREACKEALRRIRVRFGSEDAVE